MTKSQIPPQNSWRTKFSRLARPVGEAALVLVCATALAVVIGLAVGSLSWLFLTYGEITR